MGQKAGVAADFDDVAAAERIRWFRWTCSQRDMQSGTSAPDRFDLLKGVRPPRSGLLPRSVPGSRSRRRLTRTVAGTPRARDNLSARATIPPTERTGRSESTPIPERLKQPCAEDGVKLLVFDLA